MTSPALACLPLNSTPTAFRPSKRIFVTSAFVSTARFARFSASRR
jgi:hypothetical protein